MKQKTTNNPGYEHPVISVIQINGLQVICVADSTNNTDSEAKTYMY